MLAPETAGRRSLAVLRRSPSSDRIGTPLDYRSACSPGVEAGAFSRRGAPLPFADVGSTVGVTSRVGFFGAPDSSRLDRSRFDVFERSGP
jgi:hypothetical protein